MPRPTKEGLDYWTRDVGMTRDRKLRKPKQKYGYIAVGVYEELLDIIYGDKGYFVDYSDPEDLAYLVRERLDGKGNSREAGRALISFGCRRKIKYK